MTSAKPTIPSNTLVGVSVGLTTGAYVLFLLMYLAVWLPGLIGGYPGEAAYWYPLVYLLLPVLFAMLIAAIVVAVASIASARSSQLTTVCLAFSVGLVFASLPLLWFGLPISLLDSVTG
ncbi:hypothetical protein HOW07_14215 [Plantibacter sp. MCCC 1A11337]|uniref:hypothetical protein n=1 Tax=Plantibacter sp. MCCC 1A11337 TaxID=2736644 RepID=UPI0015826F4B|nr:hypothetical protein [Plantibacter sp. MCCC 1A11337]NUJ89164.1 hypothetical protein [Plantibacter sp. MCCC 1A11337]